MGDNRKIYNKHCGNTNEDLYLRQRKNFKNNHQTKHKTNKQINPETMKKNEEKIEIHTS
jgi:hypothetical protein